MIVKRLGLCFCVLFLLSCSSDSDEPAQSSLSVGIAIPSYVHAVAWLSQAKGFLPGDSASNPILVMGGSAATMRGLISNSIDVGIAGGDAVVKANQAGADLVIIAGLVNRFYHRLVAPDSIQSITDLRGKTVGLPFLGGPQDMAVRYALSQAELAYNIDVKVMSLGKEFNRLAALTKGDIQATTSQTPKAKLTSLGLHVLADLPRWDVNFPYAMVVVRRDTLNRHPEAVSDLLAGICQGIEFYQNPANQAESLNILGQYLQQSDTEGAHLERYQQAGPSLLSWPPEPNISGFDLIFDSLNLDRSMLNSFLQLDLLTNLRQQGVCG